MLPTLRTTIQRIFTRPTLRTTIQRLSMLLAALLGLIMPGVLGAQGALAAQALLRLLEELAKEVVQVAEAL